VRAKRNLLLAASCATVFSLANSGAPRAQSAKPSSVSATVPPPAAVRPVTDDYYGTQLVDPYRYMENLSDPEVQAWIKAQNDYARAVLASIPGRQKLLRRIEELDQAAPARVSNLRYLPGDLYFYEKLLAGEEVPKLYVRKGLNGEEKLLLDPETIKLAASNQGKGKNNITYFTPSDDSRYVAVAIAPGGAETNTELHVIEAPSGRESGEPIVRGLGGETWFPSWLPDNHSFVYGRRQELPPGAPAAEFRQKIRSFRHVLGTDPEKDLPVFGYGVVPGIAVDPSLIASVRTRPNSKYALGVLDQSVEPNKAFYVTPVDALGKANAAWHKVADLSDNVSDVALHGEDLYALTFKDAPRYKVLRTDARKPDLGEAEAVVAQGEGVITGISAAKDALYVRLLDGGIGHLLRVPYGAKPEAQHLALPFEGTVDLPDTDVFATDLRVPGLIFAMTSWTKVLRIYAYDPQAKRVNDTRLQPSGPYDDPANVESQEVKIPSYDGTLVPLSIVHRKGLKLDGTNPTHLYGYGAYGISQNPSSYPFFLAWYERGGVHAVCHVRGGGEYGEEWHLAGKGPTKPNSWRDFIACAEYLIDKKYTSPAHLSGHAESAAGPMIGPAMTERPDLFGVTIIDVGVLDTVRFEATANGETNIPEFGSTKTEAGFRALHAMSAYHHVTDKTPYPAVLLTTGMNDPRVDPWVSAKMAARLEAATTSGKPVLLRVDYQGGHGAYDSQTQFHDLVADEMSFMLWQSGAPEFQPQH
jgi:prolyl oligopeptidase